jgi:hypothetical protein
MRKQNGLYWLLGSVAYILFIGDWVGFTILISIGTANLFAK